MRHAHCPRFTRKDFEHVSQIRKCPDWQALPEAEQHTQHFSKSLWSRNDAPAIRGIMILSSSRITSSAESALLDARTTCCDGRPAAARASIIGASLTSVNPSASKRGR